jgi:hypothetical protein
MVREDFIKDLDAWSSHRPLLYQALEATNGSVLELGAGNGSTPYLREYCKDTRRHFRSYDSDPEWARKMGVYFNDNNWDALNCWNINWGVCLLDLSPGHYRKVALMKIKAEVIVIHDSEKPGWNASDYQVRPLFKHFKYVIDDIPKEKGSPWTSALSQTVDVTKFIV